jgi:opacity protein-like surface antigen
MCKFLVFCGLNLCLTGIGFTQEVPKVEVFAGGSYLHVHSNGADISSLTGISGDNYARNVNFNLYGWHASVTENLNSWFGGELDFSGFYGKPTVPSIAPNTSTSFSTNMHTFMYGPRISYRKSASIVPFAHALVGGAHFSGTLKALPTNGVIGLGADLTDSQTSFAFSPGVGLDVNVSNRIAIRALQIDYLMTHLYSRRQDNARISAGFLIRFGNK